MLLLFFTVWAIVIALNEMIFAGDPFTADSVMSSLPETAAISVILSAAVYLAKSRIRQALESGRAIDRNFVAELAPEVGHELNEIRRGLNEGEEYDIWYADLLGERTDLSEDDLQRLQLLFEQIYSSVTEGRAKEDPDFALMLQETASFGIDPAEIFAAIQNFTEGSEEEEDSSAEDEEAARLAAEKEQQNKELRAQEAERNIDSILNALAAPVEHDRPQEPAEATVKSPRALAGNERIKAIEAADINKITAEREAENRRRQQRLMALNKAVSAENANVRSRAERAVSAAPSAPSAASDADLNLKTNSQSIRVRAQSQTGNNRNSAERNTAVERMPETRSVKNTGSEAAEIKKERSASLPPKNISLSADNTAVERVPETRSVKNTGSEAAEIKKENSASFSPKSRSLSADSAEAKERAEYKLEKKEDNNTGVDRIINSSVYIDTVMAKADVIKPEPKELNVDRSITFRESLIDTSGLKRYRPKAARANAGPDISGLRKASNPHRPERITSNAFMNNTMSAFMTKPKAAAAKNAAEKGSTIIKSMGSGSANRNTSRTPLRGSVMSRDSFVLQNAYNKNGDEKNRVVSMKSLSPEERKNLLLQKKKRQAADSVSKDQSSEQSPL